MLSQIHQLFQVFSANLRALQSYIPQSYPGVAHLFIAQESHQDREAIWRKLVNGRLEVHSSPGDHYTMVKDPHVRVLAQQLQAQLDEV
jgi:thioesterase domain-containing protein